MIEKKLISSCRHKCPALDFIEIDVDYVEFSTCPCFNSDSPKTIADWIGYAYHFGIKYGYAQGHMGGYKDAMSRLFKKSNSSNS